MATEIVFVDADKPDHVKIGVWQLSDEEITVAYLGSVPTLTARLGGHAGAPLSLAKLLLSEFGWLAVAVRLSSAGSRL